MHRKNRAKSLKKSNKTTKKIKKILKRGKNPAKPRSRRPKSSANHKAPKSTTIELGSAAFKALQADWYNRLKAEGFKDLESATDPDGLLSTRGAQPQALFESASQDGRATYYRRLTNFISHNPNWSADKLYNLVGLLYIDGISYRAMLPIIKQRLKLQTNIWRVHKIVALLKERARAWNRTHPEGLDFVSDLSPVLGQRKI